MKTTDKTSLATAEMVTSEALNLLDIAESCLLAGDPEIEVPRLIERARELLDQRDELLELEEQKEKQS